MEEEPKGIPMSLWTCTTCGAQGLGDVYIDRYCSFSECNAELYCEEPEGWWRTSKEVLCEECKPK